jgi:hypothetical protein
VYSRDMGRGKSREGGGGCRFARKSSCTRRRSAASIPAWYAAALHPRLARPAATCGHLMSNVDKRAPPAVRTGAATSRGSAGATGRHARPRVPTAHAALGESTSLRGIGTWSRPSGAAKIHLFAVALTPAVHNHAALTPRRPLRRPAPPRGAPAPPIRRAVRAAPLPSGGTVGCILRA